jgi:hypothetical protein
MTIVITNKETEETQEIEVANEFGMKAYMKNAVFQNHKLGRDVWKVEKKEDEPNDDE